jgi:neutral ceramidase
MKFFGGAGKAEITCFIPGLGMMGYGQPHNVVKEIATPLWSRALLLKDSSGSSLLIVHLEIAFPTIALKEALLEKLKNIYPDLGLKHENVVLTAQHTHSAPGGYSHYPFYNFTIPDFQTRVVDKIILGSLEAISMAVKNLSPVILRYGEHSIHTDKEVAFNRSLKAYLNNPEVDKKSNQAEAVDRLMRGLFMEDENGKLKAFINWFGVHATSISSFNTRIHHDNKGIAAQLFEDKNPQAVAFFLQSCAGDISPNYVWEKNLKRMRGKYPDQYESACYNGEIQFNEAQKITKDKDVSGPMRASSAFINIAALAAEPAHGVAFFRGTAEGPGIHPLLGTLLEQFSKIQQATKLKAHDREFNRAHAPKNILLDHRDGAFLGIPLSFWKKLPKLPDQTLESFRLTARKEALQTLPWVPKIIPFQLVEIGPLLLVTIPGEITTYAGKILSEKLQVSFKDKVILITSYANGYMGYVTTPDEYDLQCYEGGHTVYGRNTLSALIEGYNHLALEMNEGSTNILRTNPFTFPKEELARRSI